MFYAWRADTTWCGSLAGLGGFLQGDAGAVLHLFRIQAIMANRELGRRGLVLFLLVVPSAIIGPRFNWECLRMWFHRMVTPFVVKGASSPQEVNQSFPGVLSRLLMDLHPGQGRITTLISF